MHPASTLTRWISMFALAATCTSFGSTALAETIPVWVDNENFEFDGCATVASRENNDQVATAIAVLRARAIADLRDAVRVAGVSLDGDQHLSLTPIRGSLACSVEDIYATFRIAAVDSSVGKFWSADMVVHSGPADRVEMRQLVLDLGRHLRGVMLHTAMQ